jgi:hypothetical protein
MLSAVCDGRLSLSPTWLTPRKPDLDAEAGYSGLLDVISKRPVVAFPEERDVAACQGIIILVAKVTGT